MACSTRSRRYSAVARRRWSTTAGNWPVTVSTNKYNTILTAPVVDDDAGRIFIGDGEGYLYSVKLTSPARPTQRSRRSAGYTTEAMTGAESRGRGLSTRRLQSPIPPILQPTRCSPLRDAALCRVSAEQSAGCSELHDGSPTASNTVDLGSASGNGDCTGKNVHSGHLIMHSG